MLINFSIEKHKSIIEKQTINFTQYLKNVDNKDSVIKTNDYNLLSSVLLLGKNLSGKSNIIEAYHALQNSINTGNINNISNGNFEITLLIDNIKYFYKISIDNFYIVDELLEAYPNNNKQIWFHRNNDSWKFSSNFNKVKGIENFITSQVPYLSHYNQKSPQLNILLKLFNIKNNYHATTIEKDSKKRMDELNFLVDDALKNGTPLFIDNLDINLDYDNMKKIISCFNDKSLNTKGSQLIFTATNPVILYDNFLRRDQIFFIKKEDSQTKIIPLMNARKDGKIVRKGENVLGAYLSGNYHC